MLIKEIVSEATLPIRSQVLRPGKPLQTCKFEGDDAAGSFHLGCFIHYQLVGISSYIPAKNDIFDNNFQYQLRGMAVLPDFRGKNLGQELLKAGEKRLLQEHKTVKLWFNARQNAIPFYLKHGYSTFGDLFMIPNICMHIVMHKTLTHT